MKHTRHRRHLRPRPSRSQIRHQIRGVCAALHAVQLEWLPEARHQDGSFGLREAIVQIRDEIASLEVC